TRSRARETPTRLDWAHWEIRGRTKPVALSMSPAAPRSCTRQNLQSEPRLRWRVPRLSGPCWFSSMNALPNRIDVAARAAKRRAQDVRAAIFRRLAQGFERGAHLGDEERGLLPRREVSTLGQLVVVDELRVRLLRPTARCLIELVREGAHGDRDLDAPRVEETSSRMVRVIPVEARR